MQLLAFVVGAVFGGVGVLIWNALSPGKVAKFTAKYKREIEEELEKLKSKKP